MRVPTLVAGVLTGVLSAVLAARSWRAIAAADALRVLAPITVLQLVKLLRDHVESGALRQGDLVALQGVTATNSPLTSIDGSLAVMVRTVARRLFSTLFDPRSQHADVAGVSVRTADWGLVPHDNVPSLPVDAESVAAVPAAATSAAVATAASGDSTTPFVRVCDSQHASTMFPFLVRGGSETASSKAFWLWRFLKALSSWGRIDRGTSFDDVRWQGRARCLSGCVNTCDCGGSVLTPLSPSCAPWVCVCYTNRAFCLPARR